MKPQDREIGCQDCGQLFTYSVEEQEYIKTKGYADPKRCKDCRFKRRALNDANNQNRY